MTAPRYEGHGDLELSAAERALLALYGFEPWSEVDEHGWVRPEDAVATCYDDRWAMRKALEERSAL